ncbi:MAG: D-alanyl-D-alanine carboxypeptidase/D-alanyl-D-alanine endopeptidase [Gemmatimonadaceae bacterium]
MAIDVRRAWIVGAMLAALMNTEAAEASLPNAQASIVPGGGGGATRSGPARAPRGRKTRRALAYTTPVGNEALHGDLSHMLRARTSRGEWGVTVVSLTRGDTLFAHRADASMLPASTMKLFTTVLAYETLGPAYQFRTEVLRAGALSPDGTLYGDLVLRGGGDPALSGRYIGGGPGAPADLLAAHVAVAGIKRVRGNLVADESAFELQRIPLGWPSRYLGASYAPRVSALSMNENAALVYVTPEGSRATLSLVPASSTMRLVNQVRVIAGRRSRISVSTPNDSTIVVSGTVGKSGGSKAWTVMVVNPALFVAGAFRAALAARGIEVDGDVVLGSAPNECTPVASVASPPIGRLATIMNGESVNHFAELLFRNASRLGNSTGSAAVAGRLLDSLLTFRAGAAQGAVVATDGSGLSTLNRVTARSMVHLLDYADRSTWSWDFHASLPIAGETELLRRRMRLTPAQGNLHAKTGTLSQVTSLSGYVRAQNGEQLAFAFLYNGPQHAAAVETIDAMGATLAAFTR